MKDEPETTLPLSFASENVLKVFDRKISVSMMLDIEIDQIPFHVLADGDSAVISFDGLSDAIAFLMRYKAIVSKNNEHFILFNKLLWKIGITVYCQNRHFGFIGPKANLILTKLFTSAISFGKKGKASLL